MPRVSVLMVARNTEAYINQAVTSLIQQTFVDWELIAIDDGSNDGTLEQLESWRRQDRRIRVHRHLINQGLGIVRRQSLELAFGDYAAVLDSDDVAEPDWLARRVAVLDSRPSIVAIAAPAYSSMSRVEESGSMWRATRPRSFDGDYFSGILSRILPVLFAFKRPRIVADMIGFAPRRTGPCFNGSPAAAISSSRARPLYDIARRTSPPRDPPLEPPPLDRA